jgi:hypothetical protein
VDDGPSTGTGNLPPPEAEASANDTTQGACRDGTREYPMSDDLNANVKGIVACDTLLGIMCLKRLQAHRLGDVDRVDEVDGIIELLIGLKDSLFHGPFDA